MDNDQKTAAFQERVRVRLAVLNHNQTILAVNAGMSRQQISVILQDPYRCEMRTIERLAEALEVTSAWLLEGDLREALPDPKDILEEAT